MTRGTWCERRSPPSDFVKLYHSLTPEAFEAAVSAAHAEGLKAAADLLDWDLPRIVRAIAAGLDSLEHGLVVPELVREDDRTHKGRLAVSSAPPS